MMCPNCGEEFPWYETVCPTCNVDLVEPPPGPQPTPDAELVRVFSTGDPLLTPLVKSLLEGEGIEYLVRGESVQDLFGAGRIGGFSTIAGPVEFWVRTDDAERTKALLEELSKPTSEGMALPNEDGSEKK